jgi:hypothetical protein
VSELDRLLELVGQPTGRQYYGVPERMPYQSELEFFRSNPNVAGMAAEDDAIVLNPAMRSRPEDYEAVARNEAARILMRTGALARPEFELTPEQLETFGSYSQDPQDIRETLVGRWISGDPSGRNPSSRSQENYLDYMRRKLLEMESR